jgi:hypothetical protein
MLGVSPPLLGSYFFSTVFGLLRSSLFDYWFLIIPRPLNNKWNLHEHCLNIFLFIDKWNISPPLVANTIFGLRARTEVLCSKCLQSVALFEDWLAVLTQQTRHNGSWSVRITLNINTPWSPIAVTPSVVMASRCLFYLLGSFLIFSDVHRNQRFQWLNPIKFELRNTESVSFKVAVTLAVACPTPFLRTVVTCGYERSIKT